MNSMNVPGHAETCICQACKALRGDTEDEPKKELEKGPYGYCKTFRDLVDRLGDQFRPHEMYIHPKFCVYDFTLNMDAEKMEQYLEDRSAKLFPGIHFDRKNYLLVVIDTEKGEDKVAG